ncbi:hypothetical protein CRE_03324 [Caenorhabditis remanei]|uniref:DNA2/NAM7 helicase-like C-terminal domain-containing protein n=1 Tax=Caenorhabditis remanei TaxID=31234 RepID=E3MYL4_CAERE|nr:hypothetical protein CRE_03324 [Caenorhabditis remanei]
MAPGFCGTNKPTTSNHSEGSIDNENSNPGRMSKNSSGYLSDRRVSLDSNNSSASGSTICPDEIHSKNAAIGSQDDTNKENKDTTHYSNPYHTSEKSKNSTEIQVAEGNKVEIEELDEEPTVPLKTTVYLQCCSFFQQQHLYFSTLKSLHLHHDFTNAPKNPDEARELYFRIGSAALQMLKFGKELDRNVVIVKSGKVNKEDKAILELTILQTAGKPEIPENWKSGTNIVICGKTTGCARIESVKEEQFEIQITAKLSPDSRQFEFPNGQENMIFEAEKPIPLHLHPGFFTAMQEDCNAKKVIRAFYNGSKIPSDFTLNIRGLPNMSRKRSVQLNADQLHYIDQILKWHPIIIGSGPFGSGKSMTMAMAAVLAAKKVPSRCHLLVTQTEIAAANLVKYLEEFNFQKDIPIVRYISESDSKRPEHPETDLDLPKFLATHLESLLRPGKLKKIYGNELYLQAQYYTRKTYPAGFIKPWSFEKWTSFYFRHFKPRIVVTTADSLWDIIHLLGIVQSIQFDDASQIPESTIISIISKFQHTTFGMMGDDNQLQAYRDPKLNDFLASHAIGSLMERAVENNLVPVIHMKKVYRCHPGITRILGDVFYGGGLVPSVTATERSFLTVDRTDIWSCADFPITLVNNPDNQDEITVAVRLIERLTRTIPEKDIGVIIFSTTTLLQNSLKNVKVGTVDSFQGAEKEIMILCVTTSHVTDDRKINVALSRARQGVVIIGNHDALKNSGCWMKILKEVEERGCVMDLTPPPNLQHDSSTVSRRPSHLLRGQIILWLSIPISRNYHCFNYIYSVCLD